MGAGNATQAKGVRNYSNKESFKDLASNKGMFRPDHGQENALLRQRLQERVR